MKICFIVDSIFTLGGVQRVVSVLANSLSETNKVDIVCLNESRGIDRDLYNLNSDVDVSIRNDLYNRKLKTKIVSKTFKQINKVMKFFNLNKPERLIPIYYPKEIQCKVIEFINSNEYDVVIGVEGSLSLLLAIISPKIACKTIGWQHNSTKAYFKEPNKYLWKREALFEKYIKNLDKYVVLTEQDKCELENMININNCVRIYNPLSFSSIQKSRGDKRNILFVGRLVEEQKGLDLLIEAFKIINSADDKWNLIIVGDGPDKEKLIKMINESGLNNNIFIKEPTNNIVEYYLNSSIFVSTSRWEGFGLVIIEAMECGLPVVAFNNSGPKEIIDKNNENGILINDYNVNELAYNIIKLMKNKGKREEISQNAIIRAKSYNIDSILDQWLNLIMD